MSGRLGIITNNQHQVFQRNVIEGIRQEAHERGYELVIASYAEDEAHPQPITLDYRALDGVCVIANAAPPDLLRAILEANKPLSLVSHYVPDLPAPAVMVDNDQGIAELMRHLVVDCGRRRPVFIRGVPGQWDSSKREAAFDREILRYNLMVPAELRAQGDFSVTTATESMKRLIAQKVPFDAVLATDYLMGIAAAETLRDAGYAVPGDVSVVGFGDAPEAKAAGLTTVAANVVEQGQRAARQLITQIIGLNIRGMTVLSVRPIVRKTSLPRSAARAARAGRSRAGTD